MPRAIIVLNPQPFERLTRVLELRVVEVQLARAVSLVPELLRRGRVPDAEDLARVDDRQVLRDLPRMATEVLADRRALAPGLLHELQVLDHVVTPRREHQP